MQYAYFEYILLGSFFPALQLDETAEFKCHSAPRREGKKKEYEEHTKQLPVSFYSSSIPRKLVIN